MQQGILISEVKRIFSWLLADGFHISHVDTLDASHGMYEGVDLDARHVRLSFCIDHKENGLIECYVGKIVDGELIRETEQDGYYKNLVEYLIEIKGQRSFSDLRVNVQHHDDRLSVMLDTYSKVLQKHGELLVQDSAHAFE